MVNGKWTANDIPNLEGKKIIVTGGNNGLGYETIKYLASHGANIIMASRSLEKGETAKRKIISELKEGKIEVMQLDLADLTSVKIFADMYKSKHTTLDILINNAGIMMVPYGKTKDGFEKQMGTNHLGHFALTGHLFDVINSTPKSRVVSVSSAAHKQGVMDYDNLLFEEGKDYSPLKAYGRSKLSNLLFAYELQRRFEAIGSDSISVTAHPGVATTNLGDHLKSKFLYKLLMPLFMVFAQAPKMGALPQVRAAVDPEVKGGTYYGPGGMGEMKGYPKIVQSIVPSHDTESARKLWNASTKLTGVTY